MTSRVAGSTPLIRPHRAGTRARDMMGADLEFLPMPFAHRLGRRSLAVSRSSEGDFVGVRVAKERWSRRGSRR